MLLFIPFWDYLGTEIWSPPLKNYRPFYLKILTMPRPYELPRKLGIDFLDGEMSSFNQNNTGIICLSLLLYRPFYIISSENHLIGGNCRQPYIRAIIVRNGWESESEESSPARIYSNGNVLVTWALGYEDDPSVLSILRIFSVRDVPKVNMFLKSSVIYIGEVPKISTSLKSNIIYIGIFLVGDVPKVNIS